MAFVEERRHGGILLWFLQRLSALGLLVLLLAHFYFLHYAGEGFVTYDKVAARLASPLWKAFDLTFLILAVFHGLNGLWTVVNEYVHHEKTQRLCLYLILLGGFLFLGIGGVSILEFTVQS